MHNFLQPKFLHEGNCRKRSIRKKLVTVLLVWKHYGPDSGSEKTVDSVINTVFLSVPHSSLTMCTSTTKQIVDNMKTIKMNLELGFPSKKCSRPLHHLLAKGLQYFPLTYE